MKYNDSEESEKETVTRYNEGQANDYRYILSAETQVKLYIHCE